MTAFLRSPPPYYMMSCWCCVDSLTTWGGDKSCCEDEGRNGGIHFLCKWKLGGKSRVGVFAGSCRAGEASGWWAGPDNSGAENCSCALIVAMQAFISFLNLLVCFSLFKLVMMGKPRLTDWAVLPWLIEYIIWMKNIRECVSKYDLHFSEYEVKCFFFYYSWFFGLKFWEENILDRKC